MSNYEFEAPKFVNFERKETPDADKWFDAQESPKAVARDASVAIRETKELTIPQPFKFHSTVNRNVNAAPPTSPFVPLALKVKAFETNTPDRFKKMPGKVVKRDLSKLTFPKSPYLRTRGRTHARAIPSEEWELQELSKIRPFKAKPILKGPKKEMKLAKMELTVPKSPAITKPKGIKVQESPERIIRAKPVPNLQKVFVPNIVHRVIEPLHFELPGDATTRMKKEEFEKKLLQKESELIKKRNFKAQNLPKTLDKPTELPLVETRSLTQPAPFQLETDKRGEIYQVQLKEKLEKNAQEEIQKKVFIANPLPENTPWVPDLSEKKIVIPEDIVLNTDLRAAKRQEFEELLKKREMDENVAKENQMKIQMEAEQQMIRKMRKETVHQAQPVKNFAPVIVHPSAKPLTVPESPAIGKKRSRKI